MKILAVGGGSGGHVTPVVAVFRELKSSQPSAEIRFWCDRKFGPQAKSIVSKYDASIKVDQIVSGKLRRYNTMPLIKQLTTPSIIFPNLRDLLLVGAGFIQSFFKLLLWRPDVVFTKGGFVCLPVGYAASLLRIPLVIHDSDAHPGLTNRLLARHATAIATGSPLEYYKYPKDRSHYVGIPVDSSFYPRQAEDQARLKSILGFNPDRPLVVVTGGGLGAVRINNAIADGLGSLLDTTSVMLISGMNQYDELKSRLPAHQDFKLEAFVSEKMSDVLAAADVVVARAGATTLLELAALKKPTIIVPNGLLTGGHQLKNAKVYLDSRAIDVVDENEMVNDPQVLVRTITDLIADDKRRLAMGEAFYEFARPKAARDMADLILQATA